MTCRSLMILGTASGVGKSLVTAGFCRLLSNAGYRVAPFKTQNMSNNSFVAEGGEMGRAQAVQAECARVQPHVDMNPILLKPGSDDGSQLIIQGKVVGNYQAKKYFSHQSACFDSARESYQRLSAQYDVIVLEGAGSPAEVNLKPFDIVNFKSAEMADAQCLLVADIDRGGVFASVVGTLELLEESERQRVAGIIINKFRGDRSLFDDGVKWIEERTGKKVLGVLPFDPDLKIMEEDSVPLDYAQPGGTDTLKIDIAVIYLPHISNFTDFEPLMRDPNIRLRYVRRPEDMGRPDLLILPGTKATIRDYQYLIQHSFKECVLDYAASGGRILGICGGFQMLGDEICDEQEIESKFQRVSGFGLLRMRTQFHPEKTLKNKQIQFKTQLFGEVCEGTADIYEIHMGQTRFDEKYPVFGDNGISYKNIAGTYYHGFFDHDSIRISFINALARACGKELKQPLLTGYSGHKEAQYERLAGLLSSYLDLEYLSRGTGLRFVRERILANARE